MAFCGYCGSNMPDELKFCTKCGKPLRVEEVNAVQSNDIPRNIETSSYIGNGNVNQIQSGNIANPNMNYSSPNAAVGISNNTVNNQIDIEALRKQQKKDERKQLLYDMSWMLGMLLICIAIFDYYSDPPVLTILLSLIILVGGFFIFLKALKGRVLTGIAMVIAAYCIYCGFEQGMQLGFWVTPVIQTSNTVASNNSSTSGQSSNSASSSGNSTSVNSSSSSTVDPDLKAFLDSYEDFVDDYAAFMKKYSSDPNNAFTMMGDYMEMLQKYDDFASKAERYNTDTMSQADAEYYFEVMTRIEKKMLEIYK